MRWLFDFVTPIESLIYLSGGGKWGTIAKGFSKKEIVDALIIESNLWHHGERNSQEAITFWRAELNSEKVANSFIRLIN